MTSNGSPDLRVRKNSNYTVSVIDSHNREIRFRDITGEDLEFLDMLFGVGSEEKSSNGSSVNRVTFEDIVSILQLLCQDKLDIRNLTKRVILRVFSLVSEAVLCNYLTKYDWLRYCYGIQNGSFANLKDMERVPMTKFIAMVDIHNNAVSSLSNST